MATSINPQTAVAAPTKSVGVALLLTFLFGPLGMFYSTVVGGFIMLLVGAVVFAITLPIGGIGLLFVWPICMIWGALAAHSHNKKVLAGKA